MKLYIRNHSNEIAQSWWNRFEATLSPRGIGTDGLRQHMEDRRAKLDAHGALLQWDEDPGLPYLKFDKEKDLIWFILKWS